ncbi:VOC family protein [Eubacteriales bacterium OttesenSCG-928-M02]|nr:VOC family protein [Eubacteriales bacterium OttesenSCG-928-M02]
MAEVKLADIIVDCVDTQAMQDFYLGLLEWQKGDLFGNPAVVSENGVMIVFMKEEEAGLYEAPVWPEEKGKQQKQLHFDFKVPDLAAAVEKAVSLGGVKAEKQYGGEMFVTILDPAGHPICLVQE